MIVDTPVARTFRWELGTGPDAVERWAEDWDRQAHAGSLSPTCDAIWMGCAARAFERIRHHLTLHVLFDEGRRPVAVLPLLKQNGFFQSWCSARNPEWPYWMFYLDEGQPELAARILDHLLASADFIDFSHMPSESILHDALLQAATASGRSAMEIEHGGDSFMELFGPWEEFRKALSKNVEQTTARKMRQLERQGNLEYRMIPDGPELEAVLEECLELETKGWKGVSGAPIKNNPETNDFYRDLARRSAAAGRFALYVLRLDGRLIAFEYCIRAQGKIDMLKLSYDPELSKYSPGNVLRYILLREEIEKGRIKTYHLGRPSEWKLRWATHVAPLVRLRIFNRGFRGRAAYYLGPVLRSFVKSLPGVSRFNASRR